MALPVPGTTPFAPSAPAAPAAAAPAAASHDPVELVSKIEDLLDQLKTALGSEEGAEGEGEMAPQTDDEIMAGVHQSQSLPDSQRLEAGDAIRIEGTTGTFPFTELAGIAERG